MFHVARVLLTIGVLLPGIQSFVLTTTTTTRTHTLNPLRLHPLSLQRPRNVSYDSELCASIFAVPKRHHLVPERKQNPFYCLLTTVLKPITRPLSFLSRWFFRWAVFQTSRFVTAILIDPGVNHAIAAGIKDGMNQFCTQPHVKDKLVTLQKRLSESEGPSLAKATGEDFPKTVLNFLVGVLLQGWDDPERKQQQKDSSSKPQALSESRMNGE